MSKESYAKLLKDPRWQRRRLEKLSAADWTCQSCLDRDSCLHVHHRNYRSGAMPWEYQDSELIVLCERCHSHLHETKKSLLEIIENAWPSELAAIHGYAQGLMVREGVWEHGMVTIASTAEALGAEAAFRCQGFEPGILEKVSTPGRFSLSATLDAYKRFGEEIPWA